MPLYEYRCKKCEKVFESFQKIGEKKASCPDCKSEDTERLLSSFSSHSSSKSVCATSSGPT